MILKAELTHLILIKMSSSTEINIYEECQTSVVIQAVR